MVDKTNFIEYNTISLDEMRRAEKNLIHAIFLLFDFYLFKKFFYLKEVFI